MKHAKVASRGRNRFIRLVLIGGAIVLLVLTAVSVLVGVLNMQQQVAAAEADYDTALAAHNLSMDALASAQSELSRAHDSGQATAELADDYLSAAEDGYVGAPEKLALAGKSDALDAALGESSAILNAPSTPAARIETRPDGLDALAAATSDLAAAGESLTTSAAKQRTLAQTIDSAVEGTVNAGAALVATIPGITESLLAANSSATDTARTDLMAKSSNAESVIDDWDNSVPAVIAEFVSSAHALEASHAKEEAEEEEAEEEIDPVRAQRLVVEEFATSIAGGVLLEFVWAPTVNGFGGWDSFGGTSTWSTTDGGSSTITLSHSVAEQWDVNPAAAALVAHEVGHSITSKCLPLFKTSFDSDDELWATAWAIGMGYTEPTNGEQLYGRPSKDLIALSTECR